MVIGITITKILSLRDWNDGTRETRGGDPYLSCPSDLEMEMPRRAIAIPGAEHPFDPQWRADDGHRTAWGQTREEALLNLALITRTTEMNVSYMTDANTFITNLLTLKDKVFNWNSVTDKDAAWLAWNTQGYIQNTFLPHSGPVVAYALPSDDLIDNCKAVFTLLTEQQATPANFDWVTVLSLLSKLIIKLLSS